MTGGALCRRTVVVVVGFGIVVLVDEVELLVEALVEDAETEVVVEGLLAAAAGCGCDPPDRATAVAAIATINTMAISALTIAR